MTRDVNVTWAGEAGVAACAFGLLSVLASWWFPFGPVLAVVGGISGVAGWLAGDRSGRAAIGVFLSATGLTVGLLGAWGSWVRLFGV